MKILCINIDSDTESWRLSQEEFARVGLNVERVPAITGDNKPLAFNQSVLKAMRMSEGRDLLLFEDDVVFDLPEWLELRAIMYGLHIPSNFLTLHLGCNIIGMDTTKWQMPTPYSDHLAKLHNCWQSHATLYSAECVKFILDNLDPNVLNEDNNIFDDWLRRKVLSQGRSYVMKPMIAYQRPRFSEIWQTNADYTGAHTQGNKYLATL